MWLKMSHEAKRKSSGIRLKSLPAKQAVKNTSFRLLVRNKISLSDKRNINLISKPIGEWNPFSDPEKCMICWKPLDIYGKDAKNYMECRYCHQKAHQDHMLRWLEKNKHCPYCQAKW
jgi:hypothetical protein